MSSGCDSSALFLAAVVGALVALPVALRLRPEPAVASAPKVNLTLQKDKEKVVDTVCCKDIPQGDKKVLCRCWRSKTFPNCDGSHTAHNKATGDNVGPLIIKNE